MEAYSGFGSPNLLEDLRSKGVTKLYCVGLAYDYCVGSTAEDGANNGFCTYVITDATKAVADSSAQVMKQCMQDAGVIEITHDQILNL